MNKLFLEPEDLPENVWDENDTHRYCHCPRSKHKVVGEHGEWLQCPNVPLKDMPSFTKPIER